MNSYLNKFIILLFSAVFFAGNVSLGEVIKLKNPQKIKHKLNQPAKAQKKNLVINDREVIEDLIKMQKEEEVKDIELLWKSAADRNSLIKFTINKLNTPESQRRLHSSILAKSLSSLIYGASFIPMFTGQNAFIQTASFSAGRLANNFINKSSSDAEKKIITDTELIQLAGAVEELQESIISLYYEYKASLYKLKDTRTKIVLYNKNYAEALKTNSEAEILVSSALYEDMQIQEYTYEQEAKKYRMLLERISGEKAVDSLILSQYALKNQLVNTEKIKKQ